MGFLRASLAKQTTATIGPGTLTLVANAGDTRSFQQAVGAGPVKVRAMLRGAGYFEHFRGTYTAPSTLTRDEVINSSNADTLVNIPSAAVSDVYLLDYAQFVNDPFTGNKTLTNKDASNSWIFGGSTAAALTLVGISTSLLDFWGFIKNVGTAPLTLTAAGADQIEDAGISAASVVFYPGQSGRVFLDGAAGLWRISRDGFGVAANANDIINGDIAIDQENAGASVAFTASQKFLADMFSGIGTGLTTQTISGQQVASSLSGCVKSLKFTVGGTGAAPAAAAYAIGIYKMEGFDAAKYLWGTANAKPITISFRDKSSVTGTYALAIRNSAGNRCYIASYNLTANIDTLVTLTIPGDTSGTWLTDKSVGMIISWDLGVGTNNSGAAGSWQAAGLFGLTGGTKLIATTGATKEISAIKAEPGYVATPFVPDLYQVVFAKVKRYLQKLGAAATFQYFGTITMRSTTSAYAMVAGVEEMREGVALSVSSPADFLIDVSTSGYVVTAIALAGSQAKSAGLLALTITSGPSAGASGIFQANNTTAAKITWDSRL